MNVIPSRFMEGVFVLKGTAVPRRYRKKGVYQIMKCYILKDKAKDAFKFLADKGYIEYYIQIASAHRLRME
ncbi:hypothetical protein CPT03_12825 [Pedobacter ginsengisoli]|uniref:Uncharacterized protein n=1 Tax=Pedobacter ginsengisoli TaxID=363852 RepID=A0A2D1U6T3_9SPHI|nr:hypothetical protein CPT03_12825 [Pedobacter ginsengisoli]